MIEQGAVSDLRFNEIRTLKAKNVKLDGPAAHIMLDATNAKDERGARIALSSDLAVALRSRVQDLLHEAQRAASDAGQPSPMALDPNAQVLVQPRSNSSYLKRFNDALRAACMPRCDDHGRTVDVHSLRRTCATLLLRAGVPIAKVKQHMRLGSIDVLLEIYADLGRSDSATAVAA